MKISVLGAGAWGTAIANSIKSENSEISVHLWTRNTRVAESIQKNQENFIYLPGCKICKSIKITTNLVNICDSSVLLLAVPTQSLRSLCIDLKNKYQISENLPIIICCKGIEYTTLMFPSEVVSEIFPNNPVLALSGPSFARELSQRLPCTVSLAGINKALADSLISQLGNDNLSFVYSPDIIGIQIGGALKNVIAIACGIIVGSNLGKNAVATTIIHGIEEMKTLCLAKNGKIYPETLLGPACLGDLVLSCTDLNSRNMSFGAAVGQGSSIAEILKENKVIEGTKTVKPLYALTTKLNIKLPISEIIYKLIHEKMSLSDAKRNLIYLKHE